MKKRTIKSLELNKKTISNFDASNLHGGSMTTSLTCTLGPICLEIIEATIELSMEMYDYLNE